MQESSRTDQFDDEAHFDSKSGGNSDVEAPEMEGAHKFIDMGSTTDRLSDDQQDGLVGASSGNVVDGASQQIRYYGQTTEAAKDGLNAAGVPYNVGNANASVASGGNMPPNAFEPINNTIVLDKAQVSKVPIFKKWWFWALCFCLLLMIVGACFLFNELNKPKMPSLIGFSPQQASQTMLDADETITLSFITSNNDGAEIDKDTDYANWEVVAQSVDEGVKTEEIPTEAGVQLTIQPSAEMTSEHARILDEYKNSQVNEYNYKPDDITYEDHGDYAVVKVQSVKNAANTSYLPYFPSKGNNYYKQSQIEVEQLSSGLKEDVILACYDGKWLACIFEGLYSDSPETARLKVNQKIDEICADGDAIAKKYKKRYLRNLKKNLTSSKNHTAGVYKSKAKQITFGYVSTKNYIWVKSKISNNSKNFALNIAQFTRTPASFGYIDSRGLICYADRKPRSYVYDKNKEWFALASSKKKSSSDSLSA